MNPLQKKCVIATAGCHLLLVVILFLGPGFFRKAPQTDTPPPILKTIPLNAVEAALTSGTAAVTPPAANPAPPQPTPPPPQPVTPTPPPPEPAKVVVTPPAPAPQPEPVKPQVTKPVEPTPDETKPTEPVVPDETKTETPDPAPKPPKQHKIVVDLHDVADPTPPKHTHRDTSRADEAAAEERAQEKADHLAAQKLAKAIRDAARSLDQNFTPGTTVDVQQGTSAVATANYKQIVTSIYYNAWRLPDSSESAEASPRVRVVIARDGTVISAHIIEPSGDAAVDASVQRALDSVTFIQAFAESAKENERTFTIKFDAQTKRML